MEAVALGGRIGLALVLIVAGLTKLRGADSFARAIGSYRLLPDEWARPVAVWLPRVELACGLALGVGLFVRPVAAVVAGLLAVFTAAVLLNLLNGRKVGCGCFGEASTRPAGAATVARNAVLLAAALVVAVAEPTTLAVQARTARALAPTDGLAVLICTTALMLAWLVLSHAATRLREGGEPR